MTNPTRREIGLETIKDVYAGDVVTPDEGYAFTDVMLEQLFAELWTRDTLSMRDKRILLLGIIAEKGEPTTFKIQVKASLKRGEMKPEEARELLLFIAQYAGYPRAAALIGPIEEAIAEAAQWTGFQYLGIPELDDRLETASMRNFVDTPLWIRPNAELSWQFYLGEQFKPGDSDVPVYAAPARAEDVSGLPPACIFVMEFDPLRDEGILYAMKRMATGVTMSCSPVPEPFMVRHWSE